MADYGKLDGAEEHFVAHVRIVRVTRTSNKTGTPLSGKTYERTLTELSSFTVKDSDLDSLKGKVGKHVELVDDFGGVDPFDKKYNKPGATRG